MERIDIVLKELGDDATTPAITAPARTISEVEHPMTSGVVSPAGKKPRAETDDMGSGDVEDMDVDDVKLLKVQPKPAGSSMAMDKDKDAQPGKKRLFDAFSCLKSPSAALQPGKKPLQPLPKKLNKKLCATETNEDGNKSTPAGSMAAEKTPVEGGPADEEESASAPRAAFFSSTYSSTYMVRR